MCEHAALHKFPVIEVCCKDLYNVYWMDGSENNSKELIELTSNQWFGEMVFPVIISGRHICMFADDDKKSLTAKLSIGTQPYE